MSASQSQIVLEHQGPGQAPTLLEFDANSFVEKDYISQIFSGQLSGVLVRGALSVSLAQAVVEQLRSAPGDSGPVVSPMFPGWTYGSVLVVSAPDLIAYRHHGHALRAVLDDAALPLMDTFHDWLGRLGGGNPILSPPEAEIPLTVRVLNSGEGIAIHSEHTNWPSMAALRPLINERIQLSCYTPLLAASGGGQLHLYHRPPMGQAPTIEGLSMAAAAKRLERFGLTIVTPQVGDLLLFDGGRYNHRVVSAQRGQRWTAGAFLAPGRDGKRYVWS